MRVNARSVLCIALLLAAALSLATLSAGVAGASEGEGCPNERLRRESNEDPVTHKPYSTELPECRAYEMVSPVEKAGDPIQEQMTQVSPATGGSTITYSSFAGAFSEPEGFSVITPYLATRSASGWRSRPASVAASVLPVAGGLYSALYALDLSREVICGSPGDSISSIIVNEFMCAIREGSGAWRAATPAYRQAGTAVGGVHIGIDGASRDLSHIVFNLNSGSAQAVHLLPEDTVEAVYGTNRTTGLYEISGLGSPGVTLRLVNVDNSGEQIGTAAPKLGNDREEDGWGGMGSSFHAVSEDGQTVFFEATPTGGAQTVYARLDGASTVSISSPSTAACEECQKGFSSSLPAQFQGASADGSKVFFTTEQELFPGKRGENLYEYDFDARAGARVTLVSRGAEEADVQGVLTNSDDGSHVYFVARAELTATPNGAGQHAIAGADNLYVFERDGSHPAGKVSFVAELCSGQGASGTAIDQRCPTASGSDRSLWSSEGGNFETGRDQDTPDGRYLIFDTYAQLDDEDTNEAKAVYRYDAQTGELTWISRPVPGYGATAANDPSLIPPTTANGDLMGAEPDVDNRGRAIDEDGSHVVFTTTESLSPTDVNGASDTYLWHEGTVSLVSDGTGSAPFTKLLPEDSSVMSASGEDIYLLSTAQLVAQDGDQLADLYDVRIDGGFPAPRVVECASEGSEQERGEGCQGVPAAATAFATPTSATFEGGSNLMPPPRMGPPMKSHRRSVKSRSRSAHAKQKRRLARALRSCRTRTARGRRRAACERRVRRRYGDMGSGKRKARRASRQGQGLKLKHGRNR